MSGISGRATPGRNLLVSKEWHPNELPYKLLPKNGYVYLRGSITQWIYEGLPGHLCHANVIGMIEDGDLRQYQDRIFVNNKHWLKISLWPKEMNKNEIVYHYPYGSISHGWVQYENNNNTELSYMQYH